MSNLVLVVDDTLPTLLSALQGMLSARQVQQPPVGVAGAKATRKPPADVLSAVSCEQGSLSCSFMIELTRTQQQPQQGAGDASTAAGSKRPRAEAASSKRRDAPASLPTGPIHAFLIIPSQAISEVVASGNLWQYLTDVCQATQAPSVSLLVLNHDGGGRRKVGYIDAAAELIACRCSPKSSGSPAGPSSNVAATPPSSQQSVTRTFLFGTGPAAASTGVSLGRPAAASSTPSVAKLTETAQCGSIAAAAAHVLHTVRYLASPAALWKKQQEAEGGVVSSRSAGKGRKCEASDFHSLYKRMLSEIAGCSERQASLVASVFPTIRGLLEAIEAGTFVSKASAVLDMAEKSRSKLGVGVARAIEQAVTAPLVASEGDDDALVKLFAQSSAMFGGTGRRLRHRGNAQAAGEGSCLGDAKREDSDDGNSWNTSGDDDDEGDDADDLFDFLSDHKASCAKVPITHPPPRSGPALSNASLSDRKGPLAQKTSPRDISSIVDELQSCGRLSTV